jgi:hypothetical protein
MRKITFNFKKVSIFAAVFAVAFTSCDKNEMTISPSENENSAILKAGKENDKDVLEYNADFDKAAGGTFTMELSDTN